MCIYIYTHYSNIISTYIQITFAAEFAIFHGQGGALASELVYLIGKQLGRWQQSWWDPTFFHSVKVGTGSQIQLHHLQLGGRPQVKISYLLPKHDYEVQMDCSCANTH